jgi:EAL domain-containing protein (putative c-di-GMP-specific phosphodiesterase class I)
VLKEACRVARTWERVCPDCPPVSVNLSERQLRDPALIAVVEQTLEEAGLVGRRLQLEVAESAAMTDLDGVVATLRRLREIGVRAVLDDFGTGHANLTALGRLPVDALQLDRSFVANLAASPEARAIVRAVIGLAGGLRLAVVAEGVETQEQLDLLRSWGCDAAQGALFALPAPAATITQLILSVSDLSAAIADAASIRWADDGGQAQTENAFISPSHPLMVTVPR